MFIRQSFETSKGTYGSPRIEESLVREEISLSQKTIAKYMREMGLIADRRKKRKYSKPQEGPESPSNRFSRVWKGQPPTEPRKVLVGDITYITIDLGHNKKPTMYFAAVMDVFNREIVGWALASHQRTELIVEALQNAKHAIRAGETIFHSDQGAQYTSQEFCDARKELGIEVHSFSRKGHCQDNAHMERFFHSLKDECLNRIKIRAVSELRQEVMEYVECWYNRQRFHSALGQRSPVEQRKRWTQSQAAEQRVPDNVARTTDLGPKTDQICSEHVTVLDQSSEKRTRKELI